jgi:hypothetical protein
MDKSEDLLPVTTETAKVLPLGKQATTKMRKKRNGNSRDPKSKPRTLPSLEFKVFKAARKLRNVNSDSTSDRLEHLSCTGYIYPSGLPTQGALPDVSLVFIWAARAQAPKPQTNTQITLLLSPLVVSVFLASFYNLRRITFLIELRGPQPSSLLFDLSTMLIHCHHQAYPAI